jgi:hypothetical protein
LGISRVYLDWKLTDAPGIQKALAHIAEYNNKGMAEMHARIGLIELKTEKHRNAERSWNGSEICQSIGDSRRKASALLLRGMAKAWRNDEALHWKQEPPAKLAAKGPGRPGM